MWAEPSSGLALDTEGAPVLEACSSDGFKRVRFQRFLSTLSQVRQKATDVARTLKTN